MPLYLLLGKGARLERRLALSAYRAFMGPARGNSIFCPASVTLHHDVFLVHYRIIYCASQPRVDIPWTSAFGCVTGNVPEIAFFFAIRAYVRRRGRRDQKPALAAFPESEAALGAYITCEFAFSRVTTVGAHQFLLFVCHAYASLLIKLTAIP